MTDINDLTVDELIALGLLVEVTKEELSAAHEQHNNPDPSLALVDLAARLETLLANDTEGRLCEGPQEEITAISGELRRLAGLTHLFTRAKNTPRRAP